MDENNLGQREEETGGIEIEEGVKVSRNLYQRIVSGSILLLVALAVIAAGDWLFSFFVIGVAVLMGYEWANVVLAAPKARPKGDAAIRWTFLGVAYIAIPCASIIALRQDKQGIALVMWMCFVVWATDIFAYTVGRAVGGPKILPSISPKKTWAGLIGGISGAIFVGVMAGLATPKWPLSGVIAFSAALAVISQAGDFLESYIKRHFGVKDTGSIIPGHGGVMDRVDGLVPVAPLVLIIHKLIPIF